MMKHKNTSKPLLINGVVYDSLLQASGRLGIPKDQLAKHVRQLEASKLSEKEVMIRIPTTFVIKKMK